jgi:hypothetical protein
MCKSPMIPFKDDKAHDKTQQSPHKYSLEDTPFTKEENYNQIKWIKKEEYQQLLDEFKGQESKTAKILKKVEDDVRIHPS